MGENKIVEFTCHNRKTIFRYDALNDFIFIDSVFDGIAHDTIFATRNEVLHALNYIQEELKSDKERNEAVFY